MENMDKEHAVQKLGLIVWAKIPQFADQFVCPSPKVLDLYEKRFHWASVVRALNSVQEKYKKKIV